MRVGGYGALNKFLNEMTSQEAIAEVKKSKLCGRGGAGFSTGEKWAAVAKEKGRKYLICNLDESEPGTYKDRLIVDNSPHLLLEGIILAALSIDAEEAIIYLNGNYQKQFEILEKAIEYTRQKKITGVNILGSEYSLKIKLFRGSGAYICGEETALINSIEGNRGEPKNKPPYPTQSGLHGRPTCVNNAETLVNIPWIIENGGDAYSKIGAECSPGTKLYILSGAVKNQGIIEAPTGISVRDLIYDLGGGLPKGNNFWFVQIGGASGKLVTEKELDTQLTFSRDCPIPLGSGSILVVDKTANIHDLLVSWTGFFRRESSSEWIQRRISGHWRPSGFGDRYCRRRPIRGGGERG